MRYSSQVPLSYLGIDQIKYDLNYMELNFSVGSPSLKDLPKKELTKFLCSSDINIDYNYTVFFKIHSHQ